MKTIITLFLFFFSFCSHKGQEFEDFFKDKNKKTDTLFVLNLKNKIYKKNKFQILRIYSFEKDRKELKILKNGRLVTSIDLPNGDDVNNFLISFIQETEKGFELFSLNGVNLEKEIGFFFVYRDSSFYLERIESYKYIPSEMNFLKKTELNVPIEKFVITDYLKE